MEYVESHVAPIGKRFGRLTVQGVKFSVSSGSQSHSHVVVLCDCGTYRAYPISSLVRGRCTSCGCLRGKHPNVAQWKHGGRGTQLYCLWNSMRQRCNNSNAKQYSNYGGRGIKVCDAWNDFAVFRDWMTASGYHPGLTLDRINPDKGYSPDNCQLLTRADNGRKAHTDREAKLASKDHLIDSLAIALVSVLGATKCY